MDNKPKKRTPGSSDINQAGKKDKKPNAKPRTNPENMNKMQSQKRSKKPFSGGRPSPPQLSKGTPQKVSQRPGSLQTKKKLRTPENFPPSRSKALPKLGQQKVTSGERNAPIGPSEFRPPRRAGMGLLARFMFSISGMLIAILIFFFIVVMFIANKTLNEEIKKGGATAAESLSALARNYIETVYNERFFEALLKDKETRKLLNTKFSSIKTTLFGEFPKFLAELDNPLRDFDIEPEIARKFKKCKMYKESPRYDDFSEVKRDTALAYIYFYKLYSRQDARFNVIPNAQFDERVPIQYRDDEVVASFYLYTVYPNINEITRQDYDLFSEIQSNYDKHISIFRQSIQKQYHDDFDAKFIEPIKERDPRINGIYFGRQVSPGLIDTFKSQGFKPQGITNFPDLYGNVKISNPEFGAIQFYNDFTANFIDPDIGKREDVRYSAIVEYDNSKLKKPRNWLMISIIVLALLAIIIGISVSYFLSHAVTKPIMHLVDNVQQIAQGNYRIRTQLKRRDELWVLGKTLDMMCDNLESAKELAVVYKKYKHDIDITEEVIIQLLPESIPKLTGYDISAYYHPAREVGGDYYDFIEIDDNHVGMVVADVSGKGIPGAMVMTMARTVIRFEATNNLSAREVFIKSNEHIARDIKRGMFVTAFYIILNKLKAEMQAVSAGHNPMLIWRKATGKVDKVNPNGIALGFDKGLIFERTIKEETTQLYSGDRVVIYTDGVIEAMSPDGEEFGEEKLEKILMDNQDLSSSQFTNIIEQALIEHQGGTAEELQHDDITIVTFKVQ